MHLCKIGQRLYNDFQHIDAGFVGEYSSAETYEKGQELINGFMKSFADYNNHVVHCLECNMDKREKET